MIAGPTPQLSPITSAPHSSSRAVKSFGSRAVRGVAVGHDRHLRDDRADRRARERRGSPVDLGNIGKCFQHEEIDAAFEQRCSLGLEHVFRFIERSRTVGFDAQPKWANRAGDVGAVAGGFARDAGGDDVDLAQVGFETVLAQFVSGRAEGVGLDDVGAGA